MKYVLDSEKPIDLIFVIVVSLVTLLAPICTPAVIPFPNSVSIVNIFSIAM
jgi:hypothetical protein